MDAQRRNEYHHLSHRKLLAMLLLHAASDAHSIYSHYLAEILRLEGLVDFQEAEFAEMTDAALRQHDLVIVPRLSTSAPQADLLEAYVRQGGRLLVLLPDLYLGRRFGLTPTYHGIDNGWLHINSSEPLVAGLCADPVQIIVPTITWQPAVETEASVLAQVRPDRQVAADAGYPAVIWCKVGAGEAILLGYDLAHAVARLRQGNPDHADLCFSELDGIYRPSELFVGQLAVEQMLVPQADLHTALLARLIETLAPRPRLWYYPQASQRSVVIMTSDDDWSTVEQFEALLAGLRQRQATCTFYVVPETKINDELMTQWEADGHTFSVHPALEADLRSYLATQEPQSRQIAAMLRTNVARHQSDFGRTPQTIRQHAVRWLGYVEAARELAALGVQMELNYISVHPFSLGYMSGSGRPLRFVDTDGTLIDCYQQPTLWTEEVLIHPSFVFSFKWTVERALQEVDQIVHRAANDFYTPIIFNSHPVSFATYSSPLIEGCWDRALAEGMAILSADRWLAWTQARDQARIEQTATGCTVYTPIALPELTVLLPGAATAIQAEGATVTAQTLWGQPYQMVTLTNLVAGEQRTLLYQTR